MRDDLFSKGPWVLAAFRSRQQVMQADSLMRRRGIATSIVTTPRAIAVGCGLSLQALEKDVEIVRDVLRKIPRDSLVGLYSFEGVSGSRVDVTPIGLENPQVNPG